MKNIPGPNRFALILALLLPVFFVVAALGTKQGVWSWQTGLLSLTFGAGPFLVGIVGLVALVTLIMAVWKAPRTGWWASLIALAIPLGFAGLGASAAGTASENPIHDVSTDVANPPDFSESVTTAREAGEFNSLNDYATPLGELAMWAEAPEPLASQSHADVIAEKYHELGPILIEAGNEGKARDAVESAMNQMGFDGVMVTTSLQDINGTGGFVTVEGTDETFWFGFKDDVVARIANGRIDFRSVSRVGQSDLGANAARIAELRSKVEARLAE